MCPASPRRRTAAGPETTRITTPKNGSYYIEILDVIDKYEKYCDSHKDYENNRAVHAIANVERCYDDRLKNNDFA